MDLAKSFPKEREVKIKGWDWEWSEKLAFLGIAPSPFLEREAKSKSFGLSLLNWKEGDEGGLEEGELVFSDGDK